MKKTTPHKYVLSSEYKKLLDNKILPLLEVMWRCCYCKYKKFIPRAIYKKKTVREFQLNDFSMLI
jgi:hypothetical protein